MSSKMFQVTDTKSKNPQYSKSVLKVDSPNYRYYTTCCPDDGEVMKIATPVLARGFTNLLHFILVAYE